MAPDYTFKNVSSEHVIPLPKSLPRFPIIFVTLESYVSPPQLALLLLGAG